VSNPRRRLKTGGAGELWVLATAIALLIFGIYLATGGGITQKVSQTLGLKDGIIELYNQKAATNLMYAEIKGVWVGDRTNADGKYLILDNQGSEFIVTNGQGIYKTGEHIITNKLTTTIGRPANTEIKNITFNDEDPIPKLEELKLAYPSPQGGLFIFGELTIDFPEDIELPIYANQIERISLTGNTLKFNYANLKEVITILNEQYAIGNLIIKVIEHTPSKSKIIDGDSLAPRSF
jgi:inner membrane protein